MGPMRNMFGGGPGGGLGMASAAAKLAIAILVASVLAALVPAFRALLVLQPDAVIHRFALWQPLTYIPIALEPFGVIIGALIVWSLGRSLEQSWGTRRFLSYSLGTTALAGLLTVLLALVWPALRTYPFEGATVLLTAIWVGYGLAHGSARMQMLLAGSVTGNTLAIFGIVLVGVKAAFARSLVPVMPEVFAIVCAYVYVRVGSPRILVLRFKQWKLHREAKGRSKHLRVISDERNTDRGSDRFLH